MDADALFGSLADLSHVATGEFAAVDLLRRLCGAARDGMDVDGAGVMTVDDAGVRFVHAHGPGVKTVEKLQELLRQGPCQDATVTQKDIVIDDVLLAGTQRWPAWADAAVGVGLGAVVAVPLVSRDRVWGVLDLYRRAPGPWNDHELAAARMLGDVAVSYIVMAADRDRARRAETTLAHRAMHDELTGLANRALLCDRLELALAAAARRDRSVAVFFIDLNRFKQINDRFGHAAGDAVLREASDRMAATLRREDTLARLSGDEFVVVCGNLPPRGTSELTAHTARVIDRLRESLAEPIRYHDVAIEVSASIGVATSTDGAAASDLVDQADAAMYQTKRAAADGAGEETPIALPGVGTATPEDLLTVSARDEVLPVVVQGELDVATAPLLARLLDPLVEAAVVADGDIVLDVAELEFLGAAGVNVIVAAASRLRHAGRTFVLQAPSPAVRIVLHALELDELVPVIDVRTAGTRPRGADR